MGCHFPSPGDLPDPGTEPASPAWQADPIVIVKILAPVFKRQLEVGVGAGGGCVTNFSVHLLCCSIPQGQRDTPVPSSLLPSPAPVVSAVAVLTALSTSGSYVAGFQEVPSCFL